MTYYELWREWSLARDWILPCLAYHRTHTEDDVMLRLASGEYKLWRWEKSALVTAIRQCPQFKWLDAMWAGGDLEELKTKQTEVERYALLNGCREIVSTGREGWSRVFGDYRKVGTMYCKEL